MKPKPYKNKHKYGEFYDLLRLQPNYNRQYADLIKEGIVGEFSQRIKGVYNISIKNLNESEYDLLIKEMKQSAVKELNPQKLIEQATRRKKLHKIFLKFGEIGVNTLNGYDDVNFHIRNLKGFGGRIIPEFKTDELENLYRAVCNYADGGKKQQKKCAFIARLN